MLGIGIDIHDTIDAYPDVFEVLTRRWIENGYSVHIMTGESQVTAEEYIDEYWKIQRTNFFSIVDYHRELNDVKVSEDDSGFWMDEHVWDMTKGEYARRNCIDVMFDDSTVYGNYFPDSCTYIQVPKKGFERVLKDLGVML